MADYDKDHKAVYLLMAGLAIGIIGVLSPSCNIRHSYSLRVDSRADATRTSLRSPDALSSLRNVVVDSGARSKLETAVE